MSIAEKDLKLLWARAAGHCSKPTCSEDLTARLARSGDVILGEMAHVIGRKPKAARSSAGVGTRDTYDNLILLCPTHHTLIDKAPADFPAKLLRQWKAEWESTVKRRLLPRFSVAAGTVLEMRLWAYFNYDLILRLNESLGTPSFRIPRDLTSSGIVDPKGFPITGTTGDDSPRTVYETWPFHTGRSLHKFYSDLVEHIVTETPPIDLGDVWGIRKLRALLYPGAIAFINRGFSFKVTRKMHRSEERTVTCRANGISLSFQIDTWNAYSNSSITLHFRGTNRIAALLYIRSCESVRERGRIKLEIKATPIALGTGFWPSHDRTPAVASEWVEEDSEFDVTDESELK